MARFLTSGEVSFLKRIFGNTLRYGVIRCDINKAQVGGAQNSITPAGLAYFAESVYCEDFSTAGAWEQWVFIHELTHVWQWQHHQWPVLAAIGQFCRSGGNYQGAYTYTLTPGKTLTSYNFEQQASIVADYWAVLTKKMRPQHNVNTSATPSEYATVIAGLQGAGPGVRKLDQVPL